MVWCLILFFIVAVLDQTILLITVTVSYCDYFFIMYVSDNDWEWERERERGNPFIKKSVFKTPNKHGNTTEQKRLSPLSLSLFMRLSKKPTWILMKPLGNCSTKVCFLFQFFCVFGFVLVSGFLFVLLILGLKGCGLCLFIFCSHCFVFSWFLGFWVCFG